MVRNVENSQYFIKKQGEIRHKEWVNEFLHILDWVTEQFLRMVTYNKKSSQI